MHAQALIPHLFRTEFSRITAVLCKHFGIDHLQLAEDIASETFVAALETWGYKGLPENPVAWLYGVAKNKTRNHLRRQQLFRDKIAPNITGVSSEEQPDIDLSEKNITDSQLQMLFAICDPCIPAEAQIGLALRVLSGFGIDEIANAFLSNKETINKRLFRAKEKLREEKVAIAFPPEAEISKRLENVLICLYLLFSEGYYSESNDAVLREELCREAMRLVELLLANPGTDLPQSNALYALMLFHASRFPARKNDYGELVLYGDQDTSLWDQELIGKGAYYLHKASTGKSLSRYHLEAGIAYWHTIKTDSTEKWENILQLYNHLLQMAYSPIAALNRTFALFKARGAEQAIIEAEKLQLTTNHFYCMLLGELYAGSDQVKARAHFEQALALARTKPDKQAILKRISALSVNS
jgi:RNA polymerase sigma factor (sigma-70 family)